MVCWRGIPQPRRVVDCQRLLNEVIAVVNHYVCEREREGEGEREGGEREGEKEGEKEEKREGESSVLCLSGAHCNTVGLQGSLCALNGNEVCMLCMRERERYMYMEVFVHQHEKMCACM